MTIEEAIKVLERVEDYVGIHYINGVEDPYINPYLLKAIDFAIAALREQEERRWIPMTERLPQEDVRVITLDKHGNIGIRALKRFAGEKNHLFRPDGLAPGKYITHWMPLPEPPKEDCK